MRILFTKTRQSMNKKGQIQKKLVRLMKLSFLNLSIVIIFAGSSLAYELTAQELLSKKVTLSMTDSALTEVLAGIENQTGVTFTYRPKLVNLRERFTILAVNESLGEILTRLLTPLQIKYKVISDKVILSPMTEQPGPRGESGLPGMHSLSPPDITVSGIVSDENGEPLPGVSILVKGTQQGLISDPDGKFSITVPNEQSVLVFSFVGHLTREITVGSRTKVDIVLQTDEKALEEVVVVGYGTQKKSDLTGSVVRADVSGIGEQPKASLLQLLQGNVPGLNIGQVNRAGQDPTIGVRGVTSLSGEQTPLIIVDNIIFRGNIIDLNPSDIESVDILKDASATAIYGSQASNGVILVTTKNGRKAAKPLLNYSFYHAFQEPAKEFKLETPEEFIERVIASDYLASRDPATGYLQANPSYTPVSRFKDNLMIDAYNKGITTNWYELLTNRRMYTTNHNFSISNQSENVDYYLSLGYTGQKGSIINDEYKRINARININNRITDRITIGLQSFITSSSYPGYDIDPSRRFFAHYYGQNILENGQYNLYPNAQHLNPILEARSEYENKRLHLFGNLYGNIDIPFIDGLSYRVNFGNNYQTSSEYAHKEFDLNFQGSAFKEEGILYDYTLDNIVTYNKEITKTQRLTLTMLYGVEKRRYNSTRAEASVFANQQLGYNRLQAGNSDLQKASSTAWNEASLYNMVRLFYSLRNKYMITATIRRDGFSGFSKENKFGTFPSISGAWNMGNEAFISNHLPWLNQLKLRVSYGATGNRTIGRYQTLARVESGYNFVNDAGVPVLTQYINALASPNLKWETTLGFNAGIDFGVLSNRISGSVDYYNNNTVNLLYNVDIPGINRFNTFPDNLGKLHNEGLELALTTINLSRPGIKWTSHLSFSLNRNRLKELLGFDTDNDGKEDDLVSAGLFINQPLKTIFDYHTNGDLWQLSDEIPVGYTAGSYKISDRNNNQKIEPGDRTIIGYRDPSYRFGINNSVSYKNWTLKVFVNAIQGGKRYYLAQDNFAMGEINSDNHYHRLFPANIDFWRPENPGARYQLPGATVGGPTTHPYISRSFIRLQDLSLSYSFDNSLIKKWGMSSLRLFAGGTNLFTLTKWPGWDPETGESLTFSGLPVVRSYTVGLNLEL